MFDIGFQELFVVFLVALVVFGPKRLPELGRTVGRFVFEIRKGLQNARVQMETEFDESMRKTPEKPVEPERQDGTGTGAAPAEGSKKEG